MVFKKCCITTRTNQKSAESLRFSALLVYQYPLFQQSLSQRTWNKQKAAQPAPFFNGGSHAAWSI